MSASAIGSHRGASRSDLARTVALDTFARAGVRASQIEFSDEFALGDVGRGEIVVEYAGPANARVREAFARCYARLAALGFCLNLFTSPRRTQLAVRPDD